MVTRPHSFTPLGTATAQQKVTPASPATSADEKYPIKDTSRPKKLHNQPHQPNTKGVGDGRKVSHFSGLASSGRFNTSAIGFAIGAAKMTNKVPGRTPEALNGLTKQEWVES
jgi:hypothetical protein